ncbi:MAG: ABC transporter ATP-binding protein [Anaerolineae bacterium]
MQPSKPLQSHHIKEEVTLAVDDLWISYQARRGTVKAVRGVSFDLRLGETLAFIGESGCGKTTLGLGLIRLLPKTARIERGTITYSRNNMRTQVLEMDNESLRSFRWKECAMIFQGAQNAFNPVLRIRDQVWDTARAHGENSHERVHERILDLFRLVSLEPDRVMNAYPHELSGGMRQRVLLALGLLLDPQLIILDEPTTALDILTQRSVIDVLRSLRNQLDFSLILISHDLSLAAELADRVGTMYAGSLVEVADVYDTYYHPYHPYTIGLIRAVPTLSGERRDLISIPGSPPDLIDPPTGCAFNPRCPYATERCRVEQPQLETVGLNHQVACWNWQAVVGDHGARLILAAAEE